ncbi:MAG: FxsA family protein [Acidobacteriota bacterium]
MFFRLLLLFTLLPLVELWLLLKVGSRLGVPATVALVLTTGILGAWLARRQGLDTWKRLQTETAAGRLPTDAMVDGLLILIAGTVLLTPGLLTDIAGFFLLTPDGRALIRRSAVDAMASRVRVTPGRRPGPGHPGGPGYPHGSPGPGPAASPPRREQVIIIEPNAEKSEPRSDGDSTPP